MAAAALALPRSPLYGLGSYRVGSDVHDFEVGWDEFDRDSHWAEATLRASGIAPGDTVVVTSPNWENPWTSPVVHALRRIGAIYLPAEHFAWDARRVATFLQRLPVKAFVGLGAETIGGLKDAVPDMAELFGSVEIIWARQDALATLSELGLAAVPFVLLGPALAMGIPEQRGALVNATEWTVSAADGQLLVSTAATRATPVDSLPTGLHGTVGATTTQGTVVEFDITAPD